MNRRTRTPDPLGNETTPGAMQGHQLDDRLAVTVGDRSNQLAGVPACTTRAVLGRLEPVDLVHFRVVVRLG